MAYKDMLEAAEVNLPNEFAQAEKLNILASKIIDLISIIENLNERITLIEKIVLTNDKSDLNEF